ncbi:SRPBCC family protein [Streptomyces sp. bgisy095]|uniref:SRPBCC family protein n=1 Tax=unclassified Streptomyces TaxID=2593676 RepID=UPI003D71B05C
MARWNRLIEAPPEDVWSVLSDGRLYARFVVGTHDTWEEGGKWPAPGAELGYALKIGPKSYRGRTTSRICEPGRRLEMEAKTDPGTTNMHQQLVFRPVPGTGRPRTPIRGLYLASATAHPGGGVHGAPGANAARAALRGPHLPRRR